jgi:hypothetical protein
MPAPISKEKLERLEDEADIALAMVRRMEPTISHDEMLKRLIADGTLPKNWSASQ